MSFSRFNTFCCHKRMWNCSDRIPSKERFWQTAGLIRQLVAFETRSWVYVPPLSFVRLFVSPRANACFKPRQQLLKQIFQRLSVFFQRIHSNMIVNRAPSGIFKTLDSSAFLAHFQNFQSQGAVLIDCQRPKLRKLPINTIASQQKVWFLLTTRAGIELVVDVHGSNLRDLQEQYYLDSSANALPKVLGQCRDLRISSWVVSSQRNQYRSPVCLLKPSYLGIDLSCPTMNLEGFSGKTCIRSTASDWSLLKAILFSWAPCPWCTSQFSSTSLAALFLSTPELQFEEFSSIRDDE